MLRNAGRTTYGAHLPFELWVSTWAKPSLHRFFTAVAQSSSKPSVTAGWDANSTAGSGRARSREPTNKEISFDNSKYKRSSSTKAGKIARGARPRRLLEPHILSQRLKKLCEGGRLEVAIDTLKSAPLDSQSTPVWNTLIWEVLKAQRWNLSYKLYTDVSTRPISYIIYK
jgi:hypothetical protein